jgi:hypothetical protein
MIRLSAIPANSHGAAPARVSAAPSATDTARPPLPVTALTTTTTMHSSVAGLTATSSRSAFRTHQTAAAPPARKNTPATAGWPSQPASSTPRVKTASARTTAPRAVSRIKAHPPPLLVTSAGAQPGPVG